MPPSIDKAERRTWLQALARSPRSGEIPTTMMADVSRWIEADPRVLTEVNTRGCTLAERIGQHGWSSCLVWCLDWSAAVVPTMRGLARFGRIDLLLHLASLTSLSPWTVLDDKDVRAAFARSLVERNRAEVFHDWCVGAPEQVRAELHQPRTSDHMVTLMVRWQRGGMLQQALSMGLPTGAEQARPDYPGSSLLHEVAYQKWTDGVTMLAEHGVDLNALNHVGRSPLLLATVNDAWSSALALVHAGANVHIAGPTDRKQALWHVLTRMKKDTPLWRELVLALVAAGADRWTPQGKTDRAMSPWAWLQERRPEIFAQINAIAEQHILRKTLDNLALMPEQGRPRSRL